MPQELGPALDGVSVHDRCNRWILYTALSQGLGRSCFITLLCGMASRATAPAARRTWSNSCASSPGGSRSSSIPQPYKRLFGDLADHGGTACNGGFGAEWPASHSTVGMDLHRVSLGNVLIDRDWRFDPAAGACSSFCQDHGDRDVGAAALAPSSPATCGSNRMQSRGRTCDFRC